MGQGAGRSRAHRAGVSNGWTSWFSSRLTHPGAFDDILGTSRLDGALTLPPSPVPFITDPVLSPPPQKAAPSLGKFSERQELIFRKAVLYSVPPALWIRGPSAAVETDVKRRGPS